MEMRLTPDQKIAGSTPAVLEFFAFSFFFFASLFEKLMKATPVPTEWFLFTRKNSKEPQTHNNLIVEGNDISHEVVDDEEKKKESG